MKHFLLLLFALTATTLSAKPREIRFKILETTDVHGNYFPYDYLNQEPGKGSLIRAYSFVKAQRQLMKPQHVLLLDAGDILQGQPSAYYYNFMDTVSQHACASVLNYMQYGAATVGNHDIEAGHAVYDRWTKECRMPMLGANIIRTSTGQPYWRPYTIIKKDGVRFAVLGLLTTGIPNWLPENLWSGMRFDDMVEVARKYMPEMRRQADVVIGLFHSGVGRENATGTKNENASLQVAQQVPGFDLILCGHDHRKANRKIANVNGDSVLVLNTGANAHFVAVADLVVEKNGKKVSVKSATGHLEDIDQWEVNPEMLAHFQPQIDAVKKFTQEVIGHNATELTTRPAFFGPSAFVDFIHQLQLKITGAQISFVAPLSFDARIPVGTIRVSDMFNLYKFENMLYVMQLTGQEIKDFLEYSYAGWTQQMISPSDHLLLFNDRTINSPENWQRLRTPSYNFDSAAGILYEVDVTKPRGQKITIKSLATGEPFDLKQTYRVAVNSYRGNGGGGLMTEGAGIPREQLVKRVVWSTDKDLRYYLMQEIRQQKDIAPKALNQWKFVPENWTTPAAQRDSITLFQ